jgi:ABC-type Co2+ transport system permease subunit
MNLINWRDEWNLLLETIKRQDFENVLEKSNRYDLLATMKGIAITSIATGMGSLIGGLAYGPVGALLVGSTTASMITYGANIKYKSLYEIIKQLSSEEKYQLLTNIKAVLAGVFNEQTIILGAVGTEKIIRI